MSSIKVDEARKIILEKIEVQGTEKVPINEALGRILSEDIVARRNNPPMDNSAMDGYALIANDIQSATPETPVTLDIIEDLAAGYSPEMAVKPGREEKGAKLWTRFPLRRPSPQRRAHAAPGPGWTPGHLRRHDPGGCAPACAHRGS